MNKELEFALQELKASKVIAFPTETVMGLGVIYNDVEAYNLLNKIKHRPEDKPYTMMFSSLEEIKKYALIDERVERVIKEFLPGSLTLLIKGKESLPYHVSHGSGVIGVRIPSNKEALDLLNAINLPLLVPSANRSGEKPAYNDQEVKEIFKDEIACVIKGECLSKTPSTIIDFTNEKPVLIRQGAITFEEVMKVYNG